MLEVADAACVGVVLTQLGVGPGLAWVVLFLLAPVELVLGSGLADLVLVVGVPPGLSVGLTLGLALVLALTEALALALVVLVLLALVWLPLDDVAGAAAVVVLLGELVLLSATAGCVDVDVHGLGEV